MAISAPHYHLFKSLKPILSHGGTLLEIGEANWLGDMDSQLLAVDALENDCRGFPNPLSILNDAERSGDRFAIAKAFYGIVFSPSKAVAIDINGTPDALRLDLNGPIELGEQFDLVINHGTAEHVFNIGQVFKTMHDHCIDGGLMIHESPCIGWVDHGFYTLQPTLFYDLATANNYEIVGAWLLSIEGNWTLRLDDRDHIHRLNGELPKQANLNIYVVYRKLGDMPFRVPFQGYYNGTLSEVGKRAWEEG